MMETLNNNADKCNYMMY